MNNEKKKDEEPQYWQSQAIPPNTCPKCWEIVPPRKILAHMRKKHGVNFDTPKKGRL